MYRLIRVYLSKANNIDTNKFNRSFPGGKKKKRLQNYTVRVWPCLATFRMDGTHRVHRLGYSFLHL